MEDNQTSNPEKELEPATRSIGLSGLLIVAVVFLVNGATLFLFGVYFPIILAITGPVITLSLACIVHPRILDALFAGADDEAYNKTLQWIGIFSILMGIALSIVMLLKLEIG